MHDTGRRENDKTYVYRRPGAGAATSADGTAAGDAAPEQGYRAEQPHVEQKAGDAHYVRGEHQHSQGPAARRGRQPLAEGETLVYRRDDSSAGAVSPSGDVAAQRRSAAAKGKMSKNLRISLLVGAVVVVLVACVVLAAVLPGARQGGQAAVPVSSSASDNSGNSASHSGAQQVDTVLAQTPDAGDAYVKETLFLGDSNTKRLGEYTDVTGLELNNWIGVEGMGIQGADTSALVKFTGDSNAYTMTEAVAVLQPRRVVVTFGTNNIGGYGPEAFKEAYGKVLASISESYPYADIIIGAVLPVDQYCSYTQLDIAVIEAYNEELVALAKEKGYKFLDWNEDLIDDDTGYAKPAYTVDDGVHISEKGAETMIRYFRTHSYITEDTRPGPLGAVPLRQAIPRQSTEGTGGIPSPEVKPSTGNQTAPPATQDTPEPTTPEPAPPVSTPPASTPEPAPSVVEPSQPVEPTPDPGTDPPAEGEGG